MPALIHMAASMPRRVWAGAEYASTVSADRVRWDDDRNARLAQPGTSGAAFQRVHHTSGID
jgi:hypothetical protein